MTPDERSLRSPATQAGDGRSLAGAHSLASVRGAPVNRSRRTQPKVEIENKYDVPADFVLPTLVDVGPGVTAGEPVELDLEATYFDTADLRLAHAGVALRRRTGGTDD